MKSKNIGRWRIVTLASWLIAASALPLEAVAAVSGRISDATGAPVVDATVFVYTAAPKVGTSALCPSCYPDCGKTTRSDAEGKFSLPSLSSELVFRLLVVAKAHAPKFIPNIAESSPRLDVVLEARRDPDAPNIQSARGRVVDTRGAPIHGAALEIDGAALDGGRQQFGGLRDTDPLAVTDEKGEFVITSGMPALALSGRISARGFANQSLSLATGKTHTLTMTQGASLSGRVTLNGAPVPNVTLGLTPQDRAAGSFVGNFEVGTDAAGRFTFTNLPPRTDYSVFGKMETVGRHGSIPIRAVHVGRDGETTTIGDLTVRPAHRISGRVLLEDGSKLPEKSRILVGRDRISDVVSVDLDPNGEFTVEGIPPGLVSISARIPGYKVSAKNRSYEVGNRRLIGRVEADIAGLQMLLDARDPNEGPILASSIVRPKASDRPQEHPLRGVEAVVK